MPQARALLSARLPRSRWQLFQICLRRDGATLQGWVERAIRAAADETPRQRAARPPAGEPAGAAARQRRRPDDPWSTKQIVVYVDAALLARLRGLVGTARGAAARWLLQAIERYIALQDADPALVLPPRLLRALRTALPTDPLVRTEVIHALLDWPAPVVDAASADAALGLCRAVRAGHAQRIHEILGIAAKTVDLRRRRKTPRAPAARARDREATASGAVRIISGQAGLDGAGGTPLTPLEVAVLAKMRPGDASSKHDRHARWPRGGLVPLKAPIVDARGAIQPVISVDLRSCELMTSRAGAVRGNHYHKVDWHFCYVLSGSMEYLHRPVGSREAPARLLVTAGQLVFTPPMAEHAMVFPEASSILMLRRISREQRDAVAVDLVKRPTRV